MKYTNEVYKKLVEEGVYLYNADTGDNLALTLCMTDKNKYGVFFDYKNFRDTYEEFLVLAHEYGHCKTGATHKLYSPFQLVKQHENRANRAAVYEFLPVDKLLASIEGGCTELWQIAENLDMPEQFVSLAINIYKLEEKLK